MSQIYWIVEGKGFNTFESEMDAIKCRDTQNAIDDQLGAHAFPAVRLSELEQAQSKIRELQQIASDNCDKWMKYFHMSNDQKERIAELEAELNANNELTAQAALDMGFDTSCCYDHDDVVDLIKTNVDEMKAENARLRSLVDYSREQFALLSDGEGNDIEVYRKFANVAMKFIDAALKGE